MLSSLLITLAAIVGLVSAQTNFATCCTIDPTTEPSDMLLSWCRAQTNTCPLLCQNGQTANNTCDTVSQGPFANRRAQVSQSMLTQGHAL